MHWFIDPIKNKYADFTGRATREEFWMFVLIYFVISILLSVVHDALSILFYLVVLIPALAIGARRLHDTGLSGWWQLIGLIPILGLIIMIVLFVREGETGANKYGLPVTAAAPEAPVQDATVVPPAPAEAAPAPEAEMTPAPETEEAPVEGDKKE